MLVDGRDAEAGGLHQGGKVVAIDPQVVGLAELALTLGGCADGSIFERSLQVVLLRHGQNGVAAGMQDAKDFAERPSVVGHVLQTSQAMSRSNSPFPIPAISERSSCKSRRGLR